MIPFLLDFCKISVKKYERLDSTVTENLNYLPFTALGAAWLGAAELETPPSEEIVPWPIFPGQVQAAPSIPSFTSRHEK